MVKELVERIRQKDQRAMSQFYQQYVGELSSVCYRYVPSEENAKDVLQNSFVKIFTSLPKETALKNRFFFIFAICYSNHGSLILEIYHAVDGIAFFKRQVVDLEG